MAFMVILLGCFGPAAAGLHTVGDSRARTALFPKAHAMSDQKNVRACAPLRPQPPPRQLPWSAATSTNLSDAVASRCGGSSPRVVACLPPHAKASRARRSLIRSLHERRQNDMIRQRGRLFGREARRLRLTTPHIRRGLPAFMMVPALQSSPSRAAGIATPI
jgi:hypothetical protein